MQAPIQNTPTDPLARLSKKERELVLLLADGHEMVDIARANNVSRQVVSQRKFTAFLKLGVKNEVEMVRMLIRNGVIAP